MRINGTHDISSLYVPEGRHEVHNIKLKQSNIFTDTFSISEAAKRFNASLQKSSAMVKAETLDSLPPLGKEIDASMKKAVNILERIGELSVLAQDNNLGDDARLELQIEIEDLRDNLAVLPYNLASGEKLATRSQQLMKSGELSLRPQADGSTMLERASLRARSGEEWDVKEAWNPGELRISVDDDGMNTITQVNAGWYVVDDDNVKSVRERIEANTPYSVMDAESAARTQTQIQKDIEAVQEWREGLPALIDTIGDEETIRTEAYMFLRNIVLPGEGNEVPLARADSPQWYEHNGKVYDSPEFAGGVMVSESEADISMMLEEAEGELVLSGVKLKGSVLEGLRKSDDTQAFTVINGLNLHKND